MGLYECDLLKHLALLVQIFCLLLIRPDVCEVPGFIFSGSKVYNKPGKLDLERKHCTLDSFSIQSIVVTRNLGSRCNRLNIRNCFQFSKFAI